jgi:hypothetical protein
MSFDKVLINVDLKENSEIPLTEMTEEIEVMDNMGEIKEQIFESFVSPESEGFALDFI